MISEDSYVRIWADPGQLNGQPEISMHIRMGRNEVVCSVVVDENEPESVIDLILAGVGDMIRKSISNIPGLREEIEKQIKDINKLTA